MKLLHLSDLHLGKRVNEFPMLEDQVFILNQILKIAREERPDAVLLAGDIYDKTVPGAEAVQLFDDFLCRLAADGQEVFLISGNHDSPERIAFGGRLMEGSGVHVAPVYDGHVEPVTLTDACGPVAIYLLPFLKPAQVRRFFPEREIASYTDAMRAAVEEMLAGAAPGVRRVLVAHAFVTGAQRSESEEISVGGADNVDAAVFAGFDYVALGHIHGAQNVGTARIRYCGTPLKYSIAEAGQPKSVTIAELGALPDAPAEGSRDGGAAAEAQAYAPLTIRTIPLIPLRDLREIRGSYQDLMAKSFYEEMNRTDYLHITLTDEEDIPDAAARLRVIYPNLLKLDYDNQRTRAGAFCADEGCEEAQQSPLEIFADFYERQNNQPMSEEQRTFAAGLIEKIWGDEP